MTVTGMSLSRIWRPTSVGSASKRLRQSLSLMIATKGPFGSHAAGRPPPRNLARARADAQDAKEVGAHVLPVEAFRLSDARQGRLHGPHDRHRFERAIARDELAIGAKRDVETEPP